MSDVYLHRLRRVLGEYEAARGAIAFLLNKWSQQGFSDGSTGLSFPLLEEAALNVERTYFIRLYAEFEGILKDHLLSNHPSRAFAETERPRVDEVIARVVRVEPLTVNPKLRDKLDRARDYRNSIAHSRRTPVPLVSINDAVAALGKFLDMLAEPRD